jgi:hypothetical protein
VGQQTDSWDDKVSTQVRFIREEGKAALRDEQEAPKVGSSLSFTEGEFLFGPFCWGGELGVRGGVVFWCIFVETHSIVEGRCRIQEQSGLLTYLCWYIHTVLWKPLAYQPCGILRHLQGAITCETICPFTGCGAHRALTGDGGTGSFCFLIPQTQHNWFFCVGVCCIWLSIFLKSNF